MINTSSKERLRLAHQLLDKQLNNSSYSRNSVTKESEVDFSKAKNVQSEFSDLERKLMDLERKMNNIDISSSNQEDDHVMTVIRRSRKSSRNMGNNVEQDDDKNRNQDKEKPKNGSKYSQNKFQLKKKSQHSGSQSADEDSEDDNKIYARIQSEKQKKSLKTGNDRIKKMEPAPSITVNKQPLSTKMNSINNNQANNIAINPRKPYTIQNPITMSKSKQKNQLRNSTKSVKSNKSKKSLKSNNARPLTKNLLRSGSKKSIGSQHGSRSREREGGLSPDQLRQIQLQNAKQMKKISNLEKQLNHYKRLCQKQQQKIQEFRVMEIQFRKLETNFAKSEQIRKQQKKIIENLKIKN